jgi:hypothetical protein
MTNDTKDDYPKINIREKLIHIDQMLANIDRKRQEIQLAPWQIFATLITAAAAFFAAGIAFAKLFPTIPT